VLGPYLSTSEAQWSLLDGEMKLLRVQEYISELIIQSPIVEVVDLTIRTKFGVLVEDTGPSCWD
jgi:hypothetical protein